MVFDSKNLNDIIKEFNMFKFVVIFSDRLCYVDASSFEDCLNKVSCDFPDLQLVSITKSPYFESKYKDGCFEPVFY